MSFGGSCDSRGHHLDEPMDLVCTSGCGKENREALEDHLNEVTDWNTLWQHNSGGGWICSKGNLCHPRASACCCGELRVKVLADLLVSLKPLLNSKVKRTHRRQIRPLDLRYALSYLARVFEVHTSNWLFDNTGKLNDKDKDEDDLLFTPSNTNLTEAIYAIDTAYNLCAGLSCGKKDEAETGTVVTTPEDLLAWASVSDNNMGAGTGLIAEPPAQKEPEEETIHSKSKADSEMVSDLQEGTGSSEELKAKVDGLQSQLSAMQQAIMGSLKKCTKSPRLKVLKRTSTGLPTEPRILKGSHSLKVSEDVSLETIPKGALRDWQTAFEKATPGVAREILVISESVRWHKSRGRLAKLSVVPEEFYEATQERLMRRGNHCKLITIHGCGETSWADPVTNVSPPKVSKPSESHKQQKGKTSATSDKSSGLDDLRYKIPKKSNSDSSTNVGRRENRFSSEDIRLKARTDKSETSSSKGSSSYTYKPTSYKHDTYKNRDYSQRKNLTPQARMEKIERGDGFPCIECSKWCTKEENYKCTRCKLDNVRQAKSLLRQSTNAPAGGKR